MNKDVDVKGVSEYIHNYSARVSIFITTAREC